MSFKPGDFYLGVVSFLGVLLPGAVFLFLLLFSYPADPRLRLQDWRVFAAAAYIVGHLFLAVAERLNSTADRVTRLLGRHFYDALFNVEGDFASAHRASMGSEKSAGDAHDPQVRAFRFHTALSYVRLRSAEAAAEVDHHMADYKLLRSLVLVLLLNAIIALRRPNDGWPAATIEIVVSAFAYVCFVRMYNWARYLVFDYAIMLLKGKPA